MIDQESNGKSQKRTKGSRNRAREKNIYVHRIDKLSQKLWNVKKQDKYKIVTPLFKPDHFKSALSGKNDIGFNPMDSQDIYKLDALAMIYENFDLQELNILASHRDQRKSRRCLNYICKEWSRQFGKLLQFIGRKTKDEYIDIQDVKLCADFCEQIHVKTYFIVDGVPKCLEKINRVLSDKISKGYENALLEDIRNNLYKRAPRQDDGKSDYYFNELRLLYKIYRSEICPMTRALLQIIKNEYESRGDLLRYEKDTIQHLIDKIPTDKTPILFNNLNLEEESIKEDFKYVNNKYLGLKEKQKVFWCSDLYRDSEIKPSLLEVDDGRGKSWN